MANLKKCCNYLLLTLVLLFSGHFVILAEVVYFPDKPYSWVNDFTNLIDDRDEALINARLKAYEDTTSTQIYIATLNGENDLPVDQMAFEMAEKWKIGKSGKDNGILILIYPKARQISIQTGYGIESLIPDIAAKRIIDNELKPAFREENYALGLNNAIDVIFSLLAGEYTADQYSQGNGKGDLIFFFIFIAFILFIVFAGISGKGKSKTIGSNLPFWLLLSMMSSGRGSGRGSWGGFSGGGGGGFGGFSGGGGGRFGGGGASGGW